jgi:hypothetical protein
MNFRDIRARRQGEAKLAGSGVQIVLCQAFSNLAGGAANDRILIGVVVRLALKDVHPERALFEAIEPSIGRGFYYVPQKTGTLLARAEMMALEDALQFSEYFVLGQIGPMAYLARTPTKGFRRGPHAVQMLSRFPLGVFHTRTAQVQYGIS